MKKNNLVLKTVIAMLAFGAFSVVSNFANSASVYAIQDSFHSPNWNINETQFTKLKKKAYRRAYRLIPSDDILNDIYVIENNFSKDLEFYLLTKTSNNPKKLIPYSYVRFNTLFFNNNKNSNLTWNF